MKTEYEKSRPFMGGGKEMDMENINWKQKLSSRKFWAAVVGFVSALLVGFGMADNDIAQVTSIVMAGGALIAYIFSEGWVDANRENGGGGHA